MTLETQKPRVIIADDESHIRTLLKSLLRSIQFEVVGEAKTGLEALEQFRSLRPDLVLMDINMPIMTGEAALTQIRTEFPTARIVMLTSLADMQTVAKCARNGASSYIRKDTPPSEIKSMLQKIMKDFIDPTKEVPSGR